MTTEAKKPSERIRELFYRALASIGAAGKPEAAMRMAHDRYLDEEHERRQAWEARVSVAIEKLERIASPMRYVIAPRNISQADAAALAKKLEGQATILPPGCEVVATRSPPPIPTSVALPEEDTRVMFFVPRLRIRGEWCTGRYWPRSAGGHGQPEWDDDRTASGDDRISYAASEVTHWLPMPEVPT